MKTETRFTPPPWTVGRKWYTSGNQELRIDVVGDPDGLPAALGPTVAIVGMGLCGNAESDAALIAAAPDMYAALQGAREYVGEALSLRRVMFAGHEDIGSVSDIEACIAQIDETLAKADGR